MGIGGLDQYVAERKLSQTAPLSALSGARLGVDAKQYINQLLNHSDSKEPFVQATGGVPQSISQRIENDFKTFTRFKITPVFIFSGLPTQSLGPPKTWVQQDGEDSRIREGAFDIYEQGLADEAIATFATIKGDGEVWRDCFRMVLRAMKNRMIEYIVCPYLEHSQLNYLLNHPNGYIHAIYSTNEALLWPVDKVITVIDFPASFTFIEKSKLLQDLQFNSDQFLDLGILVGSSLSSTLPIIPPHSEFLVKTASDIIRTHQSGLGAIDYLTPRDPQTMGSYRAEFIRARTAIRHGFILTTEGTVIPLPLAISKRMQPADVPGDIDSIFSQRLPDDLYYYMCKGMVSPTVLGWLTTGNVVDHVPLSDCGNYRKYLKTKITESETSQRVLCLAILQDALHPQWKERRVAAHYYFDQQRPAGNALVLDKPETLELVKSLSTWAVPLSYLKDELRRQNASTVDVCLCIGAMSNAGMIAKSTQKYDKPLDKKDEFVSNAIWRYLTVRKFINSDHTLSKYGQGLHTALTHSRGNDRFHEPLTVIIELLRSGALYGYMYDNEYRSGGPIGEDEQNMNSSMLILRCLSILPLNLRPQQWVGPVSRELLVFNSFAKAIQKSSRQLMEVVCTHMFLTGAAKRQRDDWQEILLSLPFQSDCNTGFGIVFSYYLNVTLYNYRESTKDTTPKSPDSVDSETNPITESNKDSDDAKQAKEDALKAVEVTFESVKGARQEVERGFRFWDAVLVAVRTISKLRLDATDAVADKDEQSLSDVKFTLEEFEGADKWLQPLRP